MRFRVLLSLSLASLVLTLFAGVSRAAEEAAEHSEGGMPQLDPHSYASQLFWLAVFFIVAFTFLNFVGLPRVRAILAARQAAIGGDLSEAERLRVEAETAMKTYEATLADAHSKARKLLAETQEKNAAKLSEQTKAATAEFDKRVSESVGRVNEAQTAALQGIQDVARGLVADIVTKIAGKAPSPDLIGRAIDVAAKGAA